MARVRDWTPGETAEVWVQDRGGTELRLRGNVVIEDLTGIVTSIAATAGANGPQSPVTQYILQQAAQHLSERLAAEVDPQDRDAAPKMLSTALGHQPFIESVLEMSQHQMLRRWPYASGWYHDVVAYLLRPRRFDPTHNAVRAALPGWLQQPFGEFVRQISLFQLANPEHGSATSRVADAIGSLWPEYPPVRHAVEGYREQVTNVWIPFYRAAMVNYGLVLAPGAKLGDIAWAFDAMIGSEGRERLADPRLPWHIDEQGRNWSMTGRSALMLVVGSVLDLDGSQLSLAALSARLPLADAGQAGLRQSAPASA